MRTIQHWIAGSETTGASTRWGPVWNPATGEQQAQVALAEPADVDAAVAAAAKAWQEWRDVSVIRRARVMFALRDLIERHLDELSVLVADEHGKVVSDAKGEVIRGLEVVEYACGIPTLLKGEFSEQVSTDVDAYSFRQPLGVCAGITPFNFPAMVPMWMHPVAIAAGNTFILKPSERDPSASNFIARLYADAGLPEGVFNVVHGDKVAVDAILDHPGIAAVSFVGSTPIARYVHQRASEAGKRVQALGGAKNHAVVLPDADMEFAANHITAAGYGSAGQRCMAISAVVAVGDAGDALIAKLKPRPRRSTSARAATRPRTWARWSRRRPGTASPATSAAASRPAPRSCRRPRAGRDGLRGRLLRRTLPCSTRSPPTWISIPTRSSARCWSCCGPGSFAEAVDIINANQYGNGTAIFTSSGQAARKFQRDVQVGMIGINVPIPVPMAFYSFGGWKDSLFGDTHVHGPEGIRFYTRAKAITSRWPDNEYQEHHRTHMHFPTAT
jgi:malonate-semialdehyde dehydrogenase (acetylating)/methylmalonate-semialdehyde dehydrogenase